MIPLTKELRKTKKNFKFCLELRDNINKDYPHSAVFLDSPANYSVVVTEQYYNDCLDYVKKHCKIKKVHHNV